MILLIIVLIIVIAGVIYKRKKTNNIKFATQSAPTKNIQNAAQTSIPNPTVDLIELKQYLKQQPSFKNVGKKRINSRTGYPLAKQTSIDRSRKELIDMFSLPYVNYYEEARYGKTMAIGDYLLGIELPFLHAGIVAYKQGDWDLAEKWWLSVLDIRPTNVLHKLEVMYRKEQRYKDIVQLYKIAGPLVKKYDRLTNIDTYSTYESEAILKEEAHKKEDHSIGIKTYPSKVNVTYLHLLQTVK